MDLEQVIKQSQGERYVYPDIFPDNCGLDIVLPNDKLHAVRSWGYRKNNPRRRATLEVSTFRGISFNAIHYYGKIKIQGVNMEVDGEPGHSRMVFDDNIPLAHYTYELELKRPLSKEEISEDPERWGDYYNEGDLTSCFNTIEEIIALAKEVFRLRFIGDWEFYVESPYSRYDGKLDINNQLDMNKNKKNQSDLIKKAKYNQYLANLRLCGIGKRNKLTLSYSEFVKKML